MTIIYNGKWYELYGIFHVCYQSIFPLGCCCWFLDCTFFEFEIVSLKLMCKQHSKIGLAIYRIGNWLCIPIITNTFTLRWFIGVCTMMVGNLKAHSEYMNCFKMRLFIVSGWIYEWILVFLHCKEKCIYQTIDFWMKINLKVESLRAMTLTEPNKNAFSIKNG